MDIKFCGKCGYKLYNDSNFCPSCGNRTVEDFFCQGCNKQLHPDTELCPSCGKVVEDKQLQTNTEIETQEVKTIIDFSDKENVISESTNNSEEINHLIAKSETNEDEPIKNIKEKVFKARSMVTVAKMIILLTGILVLVQNLMMLGALSTLRSALSQNQQIAGNIFKLLILVIAVGIIQGGGFIFLSKYVQKKPFIAILIAFIFEITYGILKVVISIVRATQGINFGLGESFAGIAKNWGMTALLFLQIAQMVVVTVVICYFLGKSLYSAIELRKMSER
jgi:RNA polymerase subunit RPABC4/transcription elongation factor Spt4